MKHIPLPIQWNEPDTVGQPLAIRGAVQGAARNYTILLFHESARKAVRLSAVRHVVRPSRLKP